MVDLLAQSIVESLQNVVTVEFAGGSHYTGGAPGVVDHSAVSRIKFASFVQNSE